MTGAARAIFGNWQVGGIVTDTSGASLTVDMGFDNARIRTGRLTPLRPDAVPGVDPFIGDAPDNYLNGAAFSVPEEGFLGDVGRGTLEGPGRFLTDLSLIKQIPFGLTESTNLEFRAEFFNIFNRANFDDPNTGVFRSSSGRVGGTFGKSEATTDTSRQIQFALRINF